MNTTEVERIYEFEVLGNQENEQGNPIPYLRMTQGSRWAKSSKRYFAWKSYVQDQLCKKYENKYREVALAAMKKTHPIDWNGKARTDIFISFTGKTHGDPDNILKGINDALYKNDKYVAGSVDFEEGCSSGKVVVKITLYKI